MRRKRLNHAADTLCQMFRGWRIMNSYQGLAALGSGVLVIDTIAATCTFNGKRIEPLHIAGELHAWLAEDLHDHQIPLAAICSATLTVQMTLTQIAAKQRTTSVQHMAVGGQPIRKGGFLRLAVQCASCITTDEDRYEATLSDVIEWPEDWP